MTAALSFSTYTDASGQKRRYPRQVYRCQDAQGYKTHKRAQVSLPALREAVAAAVERLSDPAARLLVLGEEPSQIPQLERELAELRGEKERVRRSLYKLDDDYYGSEVDEVDAERYRRQVARLKRQLAELDRQIERKGQQIERERHAGKRASRLDAFVEHGLAMLDEPDTAKANAFFRRHIKIWLLEDGKTLVVGNI